MSENSSNVDHRQAFSKEFADNVRAIHAAGGALVMLESKKPRHKGHMEKTPTADECLKAMWSKTNPVDAIGFRPASKDLVGFDSDKGTVEVILAALRASGAYLCHGLSSSGDPDKGHVFAVANYGDKPWKPGDGLPLIRNWKFKADDGYDLDYSEGELRTSIHVALTENTAAQIAVHLSDIDFVEHRLTVDEIRERWCRKAAEGDLPEDFDPTEGDELTEADISEKWMQRLREPELESRYQEFYRIVGHFKSLGYSYASIAEVIQPYVEAWPGDDGKFEGDGFDRQMDMAWPKLDEPENPADDFDDDDDLEDVEGEGADEKANGGNVPKWVERMNERYALVNVGKEYLVAKMDTINTKKGIQYLALTEKGFHLELAPEKLTVHEGKRTKEVQKSKKWVEHPDRRLYSSTGMWMPAEEPEGALNVFAGLQVKPIEGEWPLLHKHLFEVVCHGNEDQFEFLIETLAHMVQRPLTTTGVVPVLRGKHRTGKTFVGKLMRSFFGHHGVYVQNAHDVTGDFTGIPEHCCFAEVGEALFAADPKIRGTLKMIIMDGKRRIRRMHVDAYTIRNHLSFIMATNEHWAVPSEFGDTRFFILDVSDERKGDKEYFDALHKAVGFGPMGEDEEGLDRLDGEAAHFLHHLLHEVDLEDWSPERAPATRGKFDNTIPTMDGVKRWWFGRLRTAVLESTKIDANNEVIYYSEGPDDWRGEIRVPVSELREMYNQDARQHNKDNRFRHWPIYGDDDAPGFGRSLSEVTKYVRKRVGAAGRREYIFADLERCRNAFEEASGMDGWPWEDAEA